MCYRVGELLPSLAAMGITGKTVQEGGECTSIERLPCLCNNGGNTGCRLFKSRIPFITDVGTL